MGRWRVKGLGLRICVWHHKLLGFYARATPHQEKTHGFVQSCMRGITHVGTHVSLGSTPCSTSCLISGMLYRSPAGGSGRPHGSVENCLSEPDQRTMHNGCMQHPGPNSSARSDRLMQAAQAASTGTLRGRLRVARSISCVHPRSCLLLWLARHEKASCDGGGAAGTAVALFKMSHPFAILRLSSGFAPLELL